MANFATPKLAHFGPPKLANFGALKLVNFGNPKLSNFGSTKATALPPLSPRRLEGRFETPFRSVLGPSYALRPEEF